MLKKAKLFMAELIAKSFNLAIEILDNMRDFVLGAIGMLDVRAVTL